MPIALKEKSVFIRGVALTCKLMKSFLEKNGISVIMKNE
jgi:molecular chaperone GrpE (heat shock protein)